ncbi:GNAT family N-acetyltransferase [Roseovarius sp. S4756]|uniref:GNAT family N-acetyltransferase n=1 Tax=Roseovarius maritimus TaxID=3342637 RepID=UPI0037270FAA
MYKIVELPADKASILLPLLGQVQQLHVEAHPDIFRDDTQPSDLREFLRQFISKKEVQALACLSDEENAIGYLIYEVQEHGPTALKSAYRIGFLHQVAVDEAYRGQGVASDLIEEMTLRLRTTGVSKIRSEHFAFNLPSAALMNAAGMRPLRITVEGDT